MTFFNNCMFELKYDKLPDEPEDSEDEKKEKENRNVNMIKKAAEDEKVGHSKFLELLLTKNIDSYLAMFER